MKFPLSATLVLCLGIAGARAAQVPQASQVFRQETARSFGATNGLMSETAQLIECGADGAPQVFADGKWFALRGDSWRERVDLRPRNESQFVFADSRDQP